MYRYSARPEVLATLLVNGGAVTDRSGRVTSKMVGSIESVTGQSRHARSVGALLLDMERDGEIVRETSGRRTFRVAVGADVGLRRAVDCAALLFRRGYSKADIVAMLSESGIYAGDAETVVELSVDGGPLSDEERAELNNAKSRYVQLESENQDLAKDLNHSLELLESARSELVFAHRQVGHAQRLVLSLQSVLNADVTDGMFVRDPASSSGTDESDAVAEGYLPAIPGPFWQNAI